MDRDTAGAEEWSVAEALAVLVEGMVPMRRVRGPLDGKWEELRREAALAVAEAARRGGDGEWARLLPKLHGALLDTDVVVRGALVEALEAIGSRASVAALRWVISDEEARGPMLVGPDVVGMARRALGRCEGEE